ncbi:beta strand repeat-containing protein [Acaryochloris marina NIES-2412]|uniref:beta strand repeat-containing protein n=1 Tax=Acaryochloris marina TaxID=155978 RepID=UPI004059284A
MTQDTPKSPRRPRKLGPLTIAALLASGLVQPLLPAFAAGTDAGQQISNTATATYSETSGGPTIDATSNTVTVTVAEVAGVTAVPAGFTDLDGGAVEAGDTLEYVFDVTNVGNAATDLYIPGVNTIGTENFTPTSVEIIDGTGAVIATVPANGGNLLDAAGINLTALAPDAVLKVKVTGTPAPGTPAGADVGVTLGSTGPDNNSPTTQNQPDTGDGDPAAGNTNTGDIRTIDANPGNGAPVNGEREASATDSIPFASSVRPLALATVTKIASNLAPGATANANDDLITYDLGMSVASSSPNAAFTAADLEGTEIDVDGGDVDRILVSDAIPVGTVLSSVDTANLPANWQVVYTTTPTTGAGSATATGAAWVTTPPAPLSTVTRIGFIYTGGATLARGSAFSPFRFTVETTGLPATGGQVANIAQIFGETVGDTTNEVVYDESGDSNPNNFNDDNTPPDPTGTDYDPTPTTGDTGVADPVTQGTDTGNDNSGTGPDGEDNVVNIGDVAGSDDILNGPDGVPGANGPTDDNDDFTNQTTNVPAGVGPTDGFDPDPEAFDNTVQNPASSGFISNVTLQPISPTQAQGVDDSLLTGQYGADGDIPVGTVVTITATDAAGDIQSAVYTYDGTNFNLTSSTTDPAGPVGPSADTTPEHVNVGDLPAGQTLDYDVVVDLPNGVLPNDEIPIPILAFADDNTTTTPGYNFTGPGTPESTTNVTIERLYTGFMKLTKEVQILDENGVIVQAWTETVPPSVNVLPDYQIEYRITYENISTGVTGSGNNTLTAFDFEIVEDGNAAVGSNTNNWASFTDHEQNTSADQGIVQYFTNSADTDLVPGPLTTSDPIAGTKVDKYENEVGQVDPGQTGQFQFRRRIQ